MKRFILRDENIRKRAANFVAHLPLDQLWEIEIKLFEKTRSIQQNRRMWALLDQVADYIPDEKGVCHCSQVWHHYLKKKFGYIVGTHPSMSDSNAEVIDEPIPKSSTKMTVRELNDYMMQIETFLAEHGVVQADYYDVA